MEAAPWSPLPRPAHPSRFYALRSVAYEGPAAPAGPGGAAAAEKLLLPRLGAAGGQAAPPGARSARGARRASGEQAEAAEDEDEAIARLLRRRDTAVAEHAKVEAQLRKVLEKLPQEEALRAEAAAQADAQERLAQGVAEKLKVEVGRIRDQAVTLRDLRRQLKDLDPDRRPQQGAKPQAAAPWRSAGASGGFAPRGSARSPARAASKPAAEDAAAARADGLDSFLEDIAAELKQVTQAMGCEAPPGADLSRPQTRQAASRLTGSSFFDDAEIELLRGGGTSVARLRHPRGPEVLLDLRSGHVCSWRLADGSRAPAGSVPLLWPSCLDQEGGSPHPWRVAVMDDSNNEPSITVSCGGDSTSWTVRRTLTVTATGFTDAVYVQNVSDGSVQFTVTEAGPTEDLQGLAQEMGHSASYGAFQPCRVSDAADPWPLSITLAPKESWSAAQRWAPRSGQ